MRRIHSTPPPESTEAERWLYELVPASELPEVELSASLRSHFITNRSLQHACRAMSASSVTFVLYLASLAAGKAILFIPAPQGRILVLVVMAAGLPGALAAIGNLRYELVRVLIQTYDVWFFGCVSMVVAVLLSALFRDERSLLALISWVSFQTNTFVDASIVGQRTTLIASFFAAIYYVIMGITLSFHIVSELRAFNVLHINGHVLPAVAIIRDCLASIVAVIIRNVYRRSHALALTSNTEDPSKPRVRLVKCVSFRCNLRIQAQHAGPAQRTVRISAAGALSTSPTTTTARLFFTPFVGPLDARHTLLPSHWLWKSTTPKEAPSPRPSRLVLVGVAGFVVSNLCFTIGLLKPAILHQSAFQIVTVLAASCSVMFVSVCLATAQRQVCQALATSFDFIFIASQGSIVHFALLDMCRWQPMLVIAFCSDFAWNVWIISWDALLPPVRKRLRLTPRFAAWIGLGLLIFRTTCGIVTLVILAPHEISDRALFNITLLGTVLEFRSISWYMSCNMTIVSWAARIMWRLWIATDTELVVLDGPVAFEKPRIRKQRLNITASSITPASVGPISTGTQ